MIMKEYKILDNDYKSSLISEVNKWLKLGWKPQGGVAVGETMVRRTYFQAMIKDDEDGK